MSGYFKVLYKKFFCRSGLSNKILYNTIEEQAFIAQGLERWSSKPEVGSSILPEGILLCVLIYSTESSKRF